MHGRSEWRGGIKEANMNSLNKAIEAYADHAMMSTAEVEKEIASGNAMICKTIAILRLRFESA